MSVRFDTRNPRAEAWARERSSTLITEIVEEQREQARVALQAGLSRGDNPRDTAREIVGYYNRATKRREGGIIGLRSDQIDLMEDVGALLRDPERVREYFIKDRKTGEMKPRWKSTDRRFDAAVRKAIKEGRAVDAKTVQAMKAGHKSKLLRERGDLIARTETLRSLNAAQDEAIRQQVDKGLLTQTQVTRVWDSSGPDGRTRDSHLAMEGQRRKVGEPFTTPGGYRLMHPGDSSLGAPGSETIQCRCVVRTEIDFFEGLS